MAEAGRGADQYPVRFPDGLRERIKAHARTNNRSMNAEIVARLEASFSANDHDAIKQALREVLEERDARPERPTLQVQERAQ